MDACAHWAEALCSWSLPARIRHVAPAGARSPDPVIFRRRAEFSMRQGPTAFRRRALEALPDQGTVLDVGVGAGAGSLPLAPPAQRVVGVDRSEAMLREFRSCAEAFGISVVAILGVWPDVAHEVDIADVVVCQHVLYQVANLSPFVKALGSHARQRVVIELTAHHPQAWTADLWLRFHGLERPTHPTADDAEAALQELGLPVEREDELVEMPPAGFRASGRRCCGGVRAPAPPARARIRDREGARRPTGGTGGALVELSGIPEGEHALVGRRRSGQVRSCPAKP